MCGVGLCFVGTRIAMNILLPGFNLLTVMQLKKVVLLNNQRLFINNQQNKKTSCREYTFITFLINGCLYLFSDSQHE